MTTGRPLPVSFFARDTATVARELVGCCLWSRLDGDLAGGRIVEVEAYYGADDPASHAGRGKTPRSAIMFGPPGVAYVYVIYGMHHCLNAVTERDGEAGAVLLRALEPLDGVPVMARRRPNVAAPDDLCRGPGRLCQALAVTRACNGWPLAGPAAAARRGAPAVWISAARGPAPRIAATGRIGVKLAAERPLRFCDARSRWLSVPLREPAAIREF